MAIKFKKFYKGFSTREYDETGKGFAIYNLDCVSEDLLNEIFTIKGERINMPHFGTRIPLLVFEINDSYAHDVVREDLTTVFKNDPRVTLKSLTIEPDGNLLVATANLNYHEFQVVKDLRIEISSK